MQVKDQAQKAVNYFTSGGKKIGGNKLSHDINCYGIALKYIFMIRDLTYEDVAKKMLVTPQSVNNLVNRMKKERFNDFYVDKLCNILNIDSIYFNDLVNEIDCILGAK